MPYIATATAEIEIDEGVVLRAINSGHGMSIGTIAVAAIDGWMTADIESLKDDSTEEEIRAVEIILNAMRSTAT